MSSSPGEATGLADVVKEKVPERMLGYLHSLFHSHNCTCLSLKHNVSKPNTEPKDGGCLGTQEMLIAKTRDWFHVPVDDQPTTKTVGFPKDGWKSILKFLENFNALAAEMWEAPRKVEGDAKIQTSLFDRRPFILFPTVDYAFPLIDMFMSALVGYVRLIFIINWWNEEGLVSKHVNEGLVGLNQAFDSRYGGTKTNEGDSSPDWKAVYERICQGHRLKVYRKFCPVCRREFYNLHDNYRDVKITIQEYGKEMDQQGSIEPKCRHVDRTCATRLQDSKSASVAKMESNGSEKNMECLLQYTYYRLIHHHPGEVVNTSQIPPLNVSFAMFFDQGYIDRVKSIVIPILYDILPYVLDYIRNPRFNWSVFDVVAERTTEATERERKSHLIYSRLRDMVHWIIASDALLGISKDCTSENIRLKHYLQCLYSETLYFVICRDSERHVNKILCPEYVRANVLIKKFRKIKKRIRVPLAQDVPVRKTKGAKRGSKERNRTEQMAAEIQKERPWEEIYQRLGSLSTLLRKAGFWLAERKAKQEEKAKEEEKAKPEEMRKDAGNFRTILSLLGLASFEVMQPLRDPCMPGKGTTPTQISLKKERYYQVAALYHYDIIRHMAKMRDGLYLRTKKQSIMDKALEAALRAKERDLCEDLNRRYADNSEAPALQTDQDKKDVADVLSLWRYLEVPDSTGSNKTRNWEKAKVEEATERLDKEWVFMAMAIMLRLCLRRMNLSIQNDSYRSLIFDQYPIIQDLSAIIFLTEFTRDPCAFIDDIMGVRKMAYLKYDDAMKPTEKSMVHPEERIYAPREKAVSWTTNEGKPQEDRTKEEKTKADKPKEQLKSLFDWDFLEFVESTMMLREDEEYLQGVFYESVHSLMTTGTSTTSSATDALTNWTRRVMSAQGLQYFMSRMIISTLPVLQNGREINFSVVLAGTTEDPREVVSTYTSFIKGDLVDPTEDIHTISKSLEDASQSEEKKKEKNRNVKPWEFPRCDVKKFESHECPDAYFIHYFEMLSGPKPKQDDKSSTNTQPVQGNSTNAQLVQGNRTNAQPGQGSSTNAQPGQGNTTSAQPGQGNTTNAQPGQGNSSSAQPGQGNRTKTQSDPTGSTPGRVQDLQNQLTEHRKTFIAHLFGTNAMHTDFGTNEEQELEKSLWDLMRIGRTANISTIVKYVTKKACKFDLSEHELYQLSPGAGDTEEKEMEEKKENMLDNMVKTIMFVAAMTYKIVYERWMKEKDESDKKDEKGSVTSEKGIHGEFYFYNTEKHSLTGLDGLPQGILQVLWEGEGKTNVLDKTKASVVKLIRQLRDALERLKPDPDAVGNAKTKKRNDARSKDAEKKKYQWLRAMVNLIIDEILNVSDEITCTTISEYVYLKEHVPSFITPVFGRLARSHIERELRKLIKEEPPQSPESESQAGNSSKPPKGHHPK